MKRKNKYSSLEKKIRIKGRGNAPGPKGMVELEWITTNRREVEVRTHSPQYIYTYPATSLPWAAASH
jgi:hypothetical protein